MARTITLDEADYPSGKIGAMLREKKPKCQAETPCRALSGERSHAREGPISKLHYWPCSFCHSGILRNIDPPLLLGYLP
jgi:hypothetical protein